MYASHSSSSPYKSEIPHVKCPDPTQEAQKAPQFIHWLDCVWKVSIQALVSNLSLKKCERIWKIVTTAPVLTDSITVQGLHHTIMKTLVFPELPGHGVAFPD